MSGKGTSTIHRPPLPPRASDRNRSRLGDLSRPIQIDRRIARRRRSNVLLAIAAVAIAGAFALALFVLPIQTYFDQGDRLEQRRDQLEQLEAVNDDLRAEVARLHTDDGVREAAREQLGYVTAGEERTSILDAGSVPTDLPAGWPYSLVSGIVALRSGAAEPAAGPEPAPAAPAGGTAPAPVPAPQP